MHVFEVIPPGQEDKNLADRPGAINTNGEAFSFRIYISAALPKQGGFLPFSFFNRHLIYPRKQQATL